MYILKKTTEGKSGIQKILYILLFLVVAGGWYLKFNVLDNQVPVDSKDKGVAVLVEIPEGSGTKKIASILKERGVIRSSYAFTKYIKKEELDKNLRPGNFELNTAMTFEEIAKNLTTGGKQKQGVKFTIPEGYEIKQIAELLETAGLKSYDKNIFLELVNHPEKLKQKYEFLSEANTLEGYLYPDTYEVFAESSEAEIVQKMLDRFQNVYVMDIKDRLKERSINEIMVIASIVEREAKVDKERDMIAAVFYNRIQKGIKLESCATVQYALGERKERLFESDLAIDSPYNTYKIKGLPPAPIASPGRASILAALEPKEVSYLYFVVNPEGEAGTHHFATTYEEFLKYKKIYIDSLNK